ncbi:DNA cytosine methyltransferase [Streptomyces sp. NPDC018019]|uniref:DNA cytosine methyltransferase n=1 Tax=Streptomyces sp. NPDC018019 TaxID=3365030 RepID=UPI0037B580BB
MNPAQKAALFERLAGLGPVEWLDGFSGIGGSTFGIHLIPGQRTAMAINHWPAAVAVHQENHPDTKHDCADISQVDPRRYARTDCAWFSPSCTKHSIAQGARMMSDTDAAERSRATMWDVQRFAEVHQYRFIIVENVVEVRKWWAFRGWRIALEDTGYCLHEVFLNAAHANILGLAANQWRDRWFCLMHPKGTPCPDTQRWLAPMAQCSNCGHVRGRQVWKKGKGAGKYRTQYMYACPACNEVVRPYVRPARELIDWDRPAQLIGDRKGTLADKTMWRIEYGLRTYGASLVPVEGRDGKRPTAAAGPMRTVTTRNETGIAIPPFIAELRGGSSKSRRVTEPLSTVCASGNHHGLLIPYYSRSKARTTEQPFMTVTTVDRAGLLPDPCRGASLTEILSMHRRKSRAWRHFVNACGFRMLEPYEYARFQAFPDSYLWGEDTYSKRDRVKMIGNAVPPPMARDLVGCALESMAE